MRRLLALPLLLLAAPSAADDLKASDPVKLDITIYRDPYRDSGSIELENLGGFAVITETRRVTIPISSWLAGWQTPWLKIFLAPRMTSNGLND